MSRIFDHQNAKQDSNSAKKVASSSKESVNTFSSTMEKRKIILQVGKRMWLVKTSKNIWWSIQMNSLRTGANLRRESYFIIQTPTTATWWVSYGFPMYIITKPGLNCTMFCKGTWAETSFLSEQFLVNFINCTNQLLLACLFMV